MVRNRAQADAVIAALTTTGFTKADVSTLQLGHRPKGELINGLPKPVYTGTYGIVGAAIGTLMGLLVGLGVLSIPGIGPFFVIGTVVAAISAVFTGAAFGGIAGSVIGLGVAELHARQYESKIRAGAILMSVSVDDRDQRAHARKILTGYGATNIATVGEKYEHQAMTPALAA
jgi:hypothetical protein